MPKSKLETIYETVRDKFLADQNLSAYIRTGTGRWYCYEAVHSDFPLGGDEELGTNVADCPCVILRITDAPMELSHNALDSIPLAIRVDMRTEAQDQRESVIPDVRAPGDRGPGGRELGAVGVRRGADGDPQRPPPAQPDVGAARGRDLALDVRSGAGGPVGLQQQRLLRDIGAEPWAVPT